MSTAGLRSAGLRLDTLDTGTALLTPVVEGPPDAARAFLSDAESAGVGSFWLGEILGREAFTAASLALSATRNAVVVNAVARSLERPPKSAAGAQALLWDDHPGRYLLGLGVSGAARDRGRSPVAFLREYLDELDHHLTRLRPDLPRPPRIIGAYSAGLTALAAARTEGVVTFLVPAHTHWARQQLGSAPYLAVVQWVLFCADPVRARSTIRDRLAYYLTLPHQQAKFHRLGFTAADTTAPGSDRLVDALCAWGTVPDVLRRLDAHRAAGADQVVLGHLDPPGDALLTSLAEVTATSSGPR
ncbi:LLM class flavin-dependent oxidoreductase [Amycolatopsis rhabdoformis]|uniref:LLM class flavin-dependent oxidoreductase n=1 Tax=Amycolatopsis rhabdoformis TaxID=1448059 RepID=A0ABZ1IDB7_9PSEU|nr:LLM class flavin-dependent oxidoreductase [Amycolatopsis rhabdoformis]WSE32459.1 LLM class flavin-dependent oxidoreductase [Amycolatopsis rhabdoformis]